MAAVMLQGQPLQSRHGPQRYVGPSCGTLPKHSINIIILTNSHKGTRRYTPPFALTLGCSQHSLAAQQNRGGRRGGPQARPGAAPQGA